MTLVLVRQSHLAPLGKQNIWVSQYLWCMCFEHRWLGKHMLNPVSLSHIWACILCVVSPLGKGFMRILNFILLILFLWGMRIKHRVALITCAPELLTTHSALLVCLSHLCKDKSPSNAHMLNCSTANCQTAQPLHFLTALRQGPQEHREAASGEAGEGTHPALGPTG